MSADAFPVLVMRLRAAGIADSGVLRALEGVDRAAYVAAEDRRRAWSDQVLPLPCGQATERLDDLAAMIAALEVEPHHRVLDVGTGSGFAAAVLSRLAARVVTVERYRTLLRAARERHVRGGHGNIEYALRDGTEPPDGDVPLDRVLFTVALPEPPRHFIDRLAPDGVIVAPIGAEGEADIMRLRRVGARFERQKVGRGWFATAERGRALAL